MAFIYELQFPSGKSYIGQDSHNFLVRPREHRKEARGARSQWRCAAVNSAIQKYGMPKVVVLAEVDDNRELLDLLERTFINERETRSPDGYNIREGGRTGRQSAATIEKCRAANLGRVRSQETCDKISKAKTGVLQSPESVAKRVAKNTGKKRSAEIRERMRIAQNRPEVKLKKSLAKKGTKLSEETRANMREGARNRKRPPSISQETRERLSASSKRAWALRKLRA
jgi:hypothetical protein